MIDPSETQLNAYISPISKLSKAVTSDDLRLVMPKDVSNGATTNIILNKTNQDDETINQFVGASTL